MPQNCCLLRLKHNHAEITKLKVEQEIPLDVSRWTEYTYNPMVSNPATPCQLRNEHLQFPEHYWCPSISRLSLTLPIDKSHYVSAPKSGLPSQEKQKIKYVYQRGTCVSDCIIARKNRSLHISDIRFDIDTAEFRHWLLQIVPSINIGIQSNDSRKFTLFPAPYLPPRTKFHDWKYVTCEDFN